MGFREATPGLVITLSSLILLAIVSFNTPLLKSLNFLKATYTSGTETGTVTFGTLGYCFESSGGSETVCTGPKVGYTFDFDTIFGISNSSTTSTIASDVLDDLKIPSFISKLTYVLVLHIVALACSVLALSLGALSHIRDFSLLCFPSLFAYLTSAITLLAFIFDLVIFYIAKKRIDDVDGAQATIGVCVWLTLAAWVLGAVAGCCYTFGACCLAQTRKNQESQRYRNASEQPFRKDSEAYPLNPSGSRDGPALRTLPTVAKEREVSVPARPEEQMWLKDEEDGKDDDEGDIGGNGLNRNPSNVTGVGYGYGRREPYDNNTGQQQYQPPPQQQQYNQNQLYLDSDPYNTNPAYRVGSPATTAGSFVGIGAGRSMGSVPYMHELQQGGGGAVQGAQGYVPGGGGNGQSGYGYPPQQGYGARTTSPPTSSQGNHSYSDPYAQQQQQQQQQQYGNNESYSNGYDQSAYQPRQGYDSYASTPAVAAVPTPVAAPVPQRSNQVYTDPSSQINQSVAPSQPQQPQPSQQQQGYVAPKSYEAGSAYTNGGYVGGGYNAAGGSGSHQQYSSGGSEIGPPSYQSASPGVADHAYGGYQGR